MILLDKPYVSDFLINSLEKNRLPVINTEVVQELFPNANLNLISEEKAIKEFKINPDRLLYTNSENSIHWIEKNLSFTSFPERIGYFKDKAYFRRLISNLYPDFFFKEISLVDVENLDVSEFPFPFVIKPSVGFFSLGVYMVDNLEDWQDVLGKIHSDIDSYKDLYPNEVLNVDTFIIEECIYGNEYAIDCYLDKDGNPVVLNVLEHIFSSGKDVSDRVYLTSKKVIQKTLKIVEEFLKEVAELTGLRSFPLHIEIRIDENGNMVPIEVNPLRFGGWCTTADFTWYSNGINSYEYYFNQMKPNWNKIWEEQGDNIFSMSVLNNSTGTEGKNIKSFNYEKLFNKFETPILMRKSDFKTFPLFGFLFLKTKPENKEEIDWILKTDLKEFIEV